jgi:hypothetical protein
VGSSFLPPVLLWFTLSIVSWTIESHSFLSSSDLLQIWYVLSIVMIT